MKLFHTINRCKLIGFLRAYVLMVFVYVASLLNAQGQQIITGKVVDSETNEPIAFATVRLFSKPIGLATDIKGEFSFNVEGVGNVEIICSSVGYNSVKLSYKKFISAGSVIKLVPTSYVLDEVFIYPDNKRKIPTQKLVKQAIKNLTQTCPPHRSTGYLQHYVKEDGKYSKITEAEIIINDPVGYGKKLPPEVLRENVTYTQKRESLNNSIDKIDFKRPYFDNYINPFNFLLHNGLKYKFGSDNYLYSIEDTLYFNDHVSYIISAKDRENMLSPNQNLTEKFDMKFQIEEWPNDKYEFNITRFELNYLANSLYDGFQQIDTRTFTIDFKKSGNNYMPVSIEYILIQNTVWKNNPLLNGELFSYHKIDMYEVDFNAKNLRKVHPTNNRYNSAFWKNKPLDKNIVNDLSEVIPLANQFRAQHDYHEVSRLQDSVELNLLIKEIKVTQNSKYVYLVYWDSWEALMDFREFNYWVSKKDIKLVFVGSFLNRKNMFFIISGNDFSYFRHYNLPFSWQKSLKGGANLALPVYVLIDKNGKTTYSTTPFSKQYLDELK